MTITNEDLAEWFATITTQDNRITAEPIYFVQERRRVYGLDPAYTDDHEVVENEDGEIDDVYFVDLWLNVQPFLTERAAVNYILRNAHNLDHPRVYVASANRNPEWIFVREYLSQLVDGSRRRPVRGSLLDLADRVLEQSRPFSFDLVDESPPAADLAGAPVGLKIELDIRQPGGAA